MNDTLIQSFLSIVKEGSFAKAAEKIYISQPNLSRNIARLERELNTQLFDRTGKKAELTEAGRIYWTAFLRMENCLETAREKADMLCCTQKRMLRIGYVQGWDISNFIQPVLKRIKKCYPDVKVLLEAFRMQDLLTKFKFEQFDVILTLAEWSGKIGDIQSAVISRADKVILYSESLVDAGEEIYDPSVFQNETFYVLKDSRENMQTDYIRSIGMRYGFVPLIRSVNSIESIITNVENGLGVTVCNTWMRNASSAGLRCCRLDDSEDIVAVWKSAGENGARDIFLKTMQEEEKACRKITA